MPSEQVEPTRQIEPGEPGEQIEPDESGEPGGQIEQIEPGGPGGQIEPDESGGPGGQIEPDESGEPGEQIEPNQPGEQIERVVGVIQATLGEAVLGVYLHGSAVFGRLRPTSDLDLFVVTARRTTERERRVLIERVLPMSGRGDPTGRSRSVNFEIVAQPDVRPWRYPPRLDFQFGDWYRPDFAAGNFAPWNPANPDLAIVLAMVLQADRPLLGPPPLELFGPIPWGDVRRAMVDTIPDLLSYLEGDERNVVLTFVRIWATLATGEFRSKDAAADWALPRLPSEHRAVVEYAKSNYVDGGPEDWGDLLAGVRPCLERLIREIEHVAVEGPATSRRRSRARRVASLRTPINGPAARRRAPLSWSTPIIRPPTRGRSRRLWSQTIE